MTTITTPVAERIARPSVPVMDAMLGEVIPVLDQGFIRVIDYMGNDAAVVQAARVSYGAGTKQVSDDASLIRFLLRHDHSTPFEMCELKIHIRIPMDAWRQMIRQRTASVNEYSTRYSVAIDARQRTEPFEWRTQSTTNKQGSGEAIGSVEGNHLTDRESALHELASEVYEERLRYGVAREQARKDLPLSTYTEAYWKIDLLNLLKFLAKRMDPAAQAEIRAYAHALAYVVQQWVPMVWDAFEDYKLNSMTLSRHEMQFIEALMFKGAAMARDWAATCGWMERREDGSLKPNRERTELIAKLERLGIQSADWT